MFILASIAGCVGGKYPLFGSGRAAGVVSVRRGHGCPMPDAAGCSGLGTDPATGHSRASLWRQKICKKRAKRGTAVRGEEKSVRNSPVSNNVSEGWGKRCSRHWDFPAACGEDHTRAGISPVACGGPHAGAGLSWRTGKHPYWSRGKVWGGRSSRAEL